ncbi:MAG: hypothetical protein ABFR05_00230 [Bacteroidota bacterium]
MKNTFLTFVLLLTVSFAFATNELENISTLSNYSLEKNDKTDGNIIVKTEILDKILKDNKVLECSMVINYYDVHGDLISTRHYYTSGSCESLLAMM